MVHHMGHRADQLKRFPRTVKEPGEATELRFILLDLKNARARYNNCLERRKDAEAKVLALSEGEWKTGKPASWHINNWNTRIVDFESSMRAEGNYIRKVLAALTKMSKDVDPEAAGAPKLDMVTEKLLARARKAGQA